MDRIKWYDVPRWAKCYMNTERWEQTLTCLWIDGRYLKWEDSQGNMYIWNNDEYWFNNWKMDIVYEILDLNTK